MLPYLSESKAVKLDKMFTLSHTIISTNPEEEVIKHMDEYAEKHSLNVLNALGSDSPVDVELQAKGIRGYQYWLILSEEEYNNHKPDGVQKEVIPGSNHLMLTITEPFKDPFERIPNGWKKLMSDFRPKYEFNTECSKCGFEEVKEVGPIVCRGFDVELVAIEKLVGFVA